MTTHLCEEHCIYHLVWLTTSCTVSALAVKKGFFAFCLAGSCACACTCAFLLIWGHPPIFCSAHPIRASDRYCDVPPHHFWRWKGWGAGKKLFKGKKIYPTPNTKTTRFFKNKSCENPFSQNPFLWKSIFTAINPVKTHFHHHFFKGWKPIFTKSISVKINFHQWCGVGWIWGFLEFRFILV